MFEVAILHAEDMLERLGAHLPVPTRETAAWQEEVEKKLSSLPSGYAMQRYQLVREQHRADVKTGIGNEVTRYVTFVRGVVDVLRHLDKVGASLIAQEGTIGAAVNRQKTYDRYDVFISHASEDKPAIATPLYDALTTLGVSVWFDNAVLELGDSLRRRIDSGLACCHFGVVILSPNFLAKDWPQRELDGLFARETSSGEKAILPVLHELSHAELASRSPMLADRLSVSSSLGAMAIAKKIRTVVARARRDA